MPWKETSIMSERIRFIELAVQEIKPFRYLCKDFGISRTTGYKWLRRHIKKGKEGLNDISKRPLSSPNKTPAKTVEFILLVRDKHPTWGGDKIKSYLEEQGFQMPTEKTVDRILARHGRVTVEESQKHKPFIRFEHEHPNDLWQMDFKGHFKLTNGQRCCPLTILDDHSRFSLAIISCAQETYALVKQGLINVFKRYGLPKRMTMDNGPPWGYAANQSYTKLVVWLIKQGIKVSHSRPYHPQTQGKLERFHRILKAELLNLYTFDNLSHAQEGFDWFRNMYNNERPHGAIKAYSPGRIYQSSAQTNKEKPEVFNYDTSLVVRKVNPKGVISYNSQRYYVGEGFVGEHIGLKESEDQGRLEVFFCHQKVLILDQQYRDK